MEIQITAVTITPKCREKGDVEAVSAAVIEIIDKMEFVMDAAVNGANQSNSHYTLFSTIEKADAWGIGHKAGEESLTD